MIFRYGISSSTTSCFARTYSSWWKQISLRGWELQALFRAHLLDPSLGTASSCAYVMITKRGEVKWKEKLVRVRMRREVWERQVGKLWANAFWWGRNEKREVKREEMLSLIQRESTYGEAVE